MKNYSQFDTEDFVQDPYFRKWVLGKLPPGDSFWPTWQSAHPGRQEQLEEARSLVVALQPDDRPADPDEVRLAVQDIMNDLDDRRRPFPLLRIAAGLFLLAGLGWWVWTALLPPGSREEVNRSALPRKIQLADGTRVTLSPNSRLKISEHYGQKKREVSLTGEAFFDVVRNPEKPFLVYAGNLVTKVLGTSFTIRATDDRVSVAVRTGKVTVYRTEKKPGSALSEEMILLPNQQAVMEKASLVKTLVEEPVLLESPVERFAETPVNEVFHRLEKAYGIRILFEEDQLKDCNFTATFTRESLFDKLSFVCETIQARYEVVDGQIVIDGAKCR